MKIIYPYPMHLSNGYTYMLSISQFLNELASYEDVSLLSLDSKEQFKDYLNNVIDIKLNDKLTISKISNKKLGIKSNRLFFSSNVLTFLEKNYKSDEIVFYTRDFKQMKKMLKLRKKFKKVKYIFEVHQISSQNYCREGNYKKAQEIQKLEKYVFENVDALICITKPLSNEILKNFHKSTKNHFVLPVGFSKKFLSIFQDDKKEYDLIYSGNFSKWKGIDNLVYALRNVVDKIPNFKAVLIGTNEKEYKHYNKLLQELRLTENVQLMMRMEHKKIFDYVQKSSIGVLPNTYEGDALLFTSPLKLYEYLGAGIKVVCSKLPSIESAIEDDLVYWSKPESVESLSSQILKAYSDNTFDENIQKSFAENFTWESRAKKFSDFLRQLK